jgi:hypothetical protein
MNTTPQDATPRDIGSYAALTEWITQHWHQPQALQQAIALLQPFVQQHTRAMRSKPSSIVSEPWRSAAWTVPGQQHSAIGQEPQLQPTALRWLDDPQHAQTLVDTLTTQALLDLSGLTTLSAPVAQVLAGFSGTLDLSGLSTLEPDAAQALAAHRGLIRLDGLPRLGGFIVPLVQRRIPRQPDQPSVEQPGLSLQGLQQLSGEDAHYLSHVQGDLDLGGLQSISAQLAGALTRRNASTDLPLGWLRLDGWQNPGADALKALAPYSGPLSLPLEQGSNLNNLLSQLKQQPRAALALPRLQSLNVPLCELLASLPVQEMHLNGVQALDRPCAVVLAKAQWVALHLGGVSTLTPEVAAALLQQNEFGTALHMDKLQPSPELQRVLQKHEHLDGDLATWVWG